MASTTISHVEANRISGKELQSPFLSAALIGIPASLAGFASATWIPASILAFASAKSSSVYFANQVKEYVEDAVASNEKLPKYLEDLYAQEEALQKAYTTVKSGKGTPETQNEVYNLLRTKINSPDERDWEEYKANDNTDNVLSAISQKTKSKVRGKIKIGKVAGLALLVGGAVVVGSALSVPGIVIAATGKALAGMTAAGIGLGLSMSSGYAGQHLDAAELDSLKNATKKRHEHLSTAREVFGNIQNLRRSIVDLTTDEDARPSFYKRFGVS